MLTSATRAKAKVYLVIQNAWDSELLTMPLAFGYIKAYAMADPAIRADVDIRIFNYKRSTSVSEMAVELFAEPPDILAFSVLGWNFNNFGRLCETYKQVRPNGWCVLGGNHASNQAARVFRLFPAADLVVNGEGEITMTEVLRAYLAGRRPTDCTDIHGLSVHGGGGNFITTPERPRLRNLDVVPSPFLTGAIPMVGADGRFLYDVALMETNRGCPYSCSFCYWGGAVGQKIYAFSRDRLREELRFFGRHNVDSLALCDANFGMLPADNEFVEDMLAVRAEFGYPRNFLTSWAKNKNRVFLSIVERLRDAGLHSSFTLSLQTLSPDALEHMQRKNMKLNEFEDLCEWLVGQGLDTDVELIWGAPGETPQSFFAGYDRVSRYVTRIATYPMLVLPNTEYERSKERHRMVTVRDTATDFEFVLSHSTLSLAENRQMHHFLFWARVLAEHQVLRLLFPAALRLARMTQSQVLQSIDRWFADCEVPAARGLKAHLRDVVANLDITRVTNAVAYTYVAEAELEPVFRGWWEAEVLPRAKAEDREMLEDIFRYDWLSRPYHDAAASKAGARSETIGGERFWVRRCIGLRYDLHATASDMKARRDVVPERVPARDFDLYFREGFALVVANHELVTAYAARTWEDLQDEAAAARAGRRTKSDVVLANGGGVTLGVSSGGRLVGEVAP
jgi:radical SAM superfamily enzyme YgiQ (UPF0313 family)